MATSILDKICAQRRKDVVEAQSKLPLAELRRLVEEQKVNVRGGPAFPLVNFPSRILVSAPAIAVLAEVKRASPSKGDIAPGIDAAQQGKLYADAGAAVISCLTEPTWFKGTLEDMCGIREAIGAMGESRRPALLRKDFVLDEYQIYEARYYGADTVLLIVAALEEAELVRLIKCSRELGMEPLVETANAEEMEVALRVGAKVIGINNRNLHTFSVDLNTTNRLLADVAQSAEGVIFTALSGISTREDVVHFEKAGVSGVLVGESLMRAADPAAKIRELQGRTEAKPPALVKICGLKDVPTAIATAEAGADMIGLVFAESRRKVTIEQAREIVDALDKWRTAQGQSSPSAELLAAGPGEESFGSWAVKLHSAAEKRRPLIVGVFADNDVEMMNEVATAAGLDLIQLSGKESPAVAQQLVRPCLKAIHVNGQPEEINSTIAGFAGGNVVGILLDTYDPHALGGTGRAFDWSIAKGVQEKTPIFVAGGLGPQNVAAAVSASAPLGVDVSSGVETDSVKDVTKIRAFIQNAKTATGGEQVADGSQFYLYGSPIGNSPSPLLHNTGFETLGIADQHRYQLCDTKDVKQVVVSLRDRRTGGGSVTMPHKQTVMPFLDQISPGARAIGAVNTVSKDPAGRLLGDNTDWLAIHQLTRQRLAALGKTGAKPVGLVIGAGGTAHAACYALTQLDAEFYIYNRTPARAQHLADRFAGVRGLPSTPDELAALAGRVDVVISTVPPTADFTLPDAFFRRPSGPDAVSAAAGLVVVELVYWPRFTPLLDQVRQCAKNDENVVRVEVVEGIEILLAQGLAQFEIWTGREAPRAAIVEKIVATFKDGLYASPLPTSFQE